MEQKKEIVLLDTFDDGEYSYSAYLEYCADFGLEPAGEYSAPYQMWVSEEIWNDVECFFINLRNAKGVVGESCVITGTLGLWWGRPEITPTVCENLASAVHKCIGDCDYYRVTSNDGVVYVEATHHDGTNSFEIRSVSGEKYPKYLF